MAGGAGVASLVCAIMRRISGVLMAQLALIKPKCRPCMQPEGRTCCRNLRIHSKTASWVVRGRALPGVLRCARGRLGERARDAAPWALKIEVSGGMPATLA